jgi:hypothetical protein
MTLKYGYVHLYRTRRNSAIDTRTHNNPDDLSTSDCYTEPRQSHKVAKSGDYTLLLDLKQV